MCLCASCLLPTRSSIKPLLRIRSSCASRCRRTRRCRRARRRRRRWPGRRARSSSPSCPTPGRARRASAARLAVGERHGRHDIRRHDPFAARTFSANAAAKSGEQLEPVALRQQLDGSRHFGGSPRRPPRARAATIACFLAGGTDAAREHPAQLGAAGHERRARATRSLRRALGARRSSRPTRRARPRNARRRTATSRVQLRLRCSGSHSTNGRVMSRVPIQDGRRLTAVKRQFIPFGARPGKVVPGRFSRGERGPRRGRIARRGRRPKS